MLGSQTDEWKRKRSIVVKRALPRHGKRITEKTLSHIRRRKTKSTEKRERGYTRDFLRSTNRSRLLSIDWLQEKRCTEDELWRTFLVFHTARHMYPFFFLSLCSFFQISLGGLYPARYSDSLVSERSPLSLLHCSISGDRTEVSTDEISIGSHVFPSSKEKFVSPYTWFTHRQT